MKAVRLAALVAGALSCAGSVSGSAPFPVAVVEEVTGNPAGVEFMDYVEAGKVIRLKAQDSIVLSYIKSCVRETITGGTVIVGGERSEVQSGTVERTTVKCGTGNMQLTGPEANQFAGMVFRSASPRAQPEPAPEPQLTLYGVSPIIELKGPGTLVIERLDKAGERHVLKIDKRQLLRGKFYDLANARKALVAGGIYRAVAGAQRIVFKVDPEAKSGRVPIISRLLRLESAS